MIIRKPYAFLIKNFKKIHILLLALSIYIFFKCVQLSSFINNFISLGSYNSSYESIGNYVNIFVYFILIVIIGILLLVIILLNRKKKPWKSYLVPLIGYSIILVLMFIIKSYYTSYTIETSTATIRTLRGFFTIISLTQYFAFVIYTVRILGLDLNKFNFKSDQEFLELSSEDREQIEINIDIDKESFIRKYKSLKRHIGYVYQEHKFVSNIVIGIISVVILFNIYNFIFIVNKVYKEGQVLNSSGYQIVVNNSYYTDKDTKGNIIDKGKYFIVVNMSVTNNSSRREMNLSRFHLVNKSYGVDYKGSTYSNSFSDLGKTNVKTTIGKNGTMNTLLIFEVTEKNLNINNFVLYYEQVNSYYDVVNKKIKLKAVDLTKVTKSDTKTLGEKISMETVADGKKNLIIENEEVVDTVKYNKEICSSSGCVVTEKKFNSVNDNSILHIAFTSSSFDNKQLIDFSTKYGKIKYKDSNGKTKTIDMVSYVTGSYIGDDLFLKVPKELKDSKSIKFIYTVRNKKYTYGVR